MSRKTPELTFTDPQKASDLQPAIKQEPPKIEQFISIMDNLLNVNNILTLESNNAYGNSDRLKAKSANNKNSTEEEGKFSIASLKYKTENLESHKNTFFVLKENMNEDDDMSLKIKRETLVSKLMHNPAIKIDKVFQSNIHDSILSSIYLTLSKESRNFLNSDLEDNDYSIIHKVIGFDKEKLKEKDYRIRNEQIMNMCEKILLFDDLNFEDRPFGLDGNTSNHISPKSIKPKIENTINEDKRRRESYISPVMEMKNDRQIEINISTPVEKDEDFDWEEYNFFLSFIESSDFAPIQEKIKKLLFLIQSGDAKMGLTNKLKNELLRNLRKEYIHNLEELEKSEIINKTHDEESRLNQVTPVKRLDNPFEDNLHLEKEEENYKEKEKEKVDKIRKPVRISEKISYMNSGWGVSDKKSSHNLISSASGKKDNSIKGKKVVHSTNQRVYTDKSFRLKPLNDDWEDDSSSGEWVLQKNK